MDFSKQTKVDKSLSIDDRISFLKFCADKYETDGSSPISDLEYDREYYELEQIDPDNQFFETVGGLDEEHVYGTKVKHDIIMGSLSKCPTIEDFKIWLDANFLQGENTSFTLQHKIDGLSLSLLYRDGKLVRAATRGDGEVGCDVTSNAIYVDGVKENISCLEEIEIRGECYKDKKDFYENWAKEYANPRNFTAGSLNQKDTKVTKERKLSFIAYEVVRKDFAFEIDKVNFLDSIGFNTLKSSTKRTKAGNTLEQIVSAVDFYMTTIDRANLPYDIDGIVVKSSNIALGKVMGSVAGGRKPKSARAVKFPPEEAVTKLIGVEINTGRTGRVTPVGLLEPVSLAGTIVRRATLHNFGEVFGNDAIKIGATIVIAKKGDIIPQIVRVDKNEGVSINIPTICPSCGEPITWNDTHVDLICDNLLCPAQAAKRIDNWFKVLGVKNIGKKTLLKLITLQWENEPIVNCISDMYYKLDNDRKTEHPFRKYAFIKENFGDVTYENIIKAVSSVKEVPLHIFVCALGIGKIGSMSKDITDIAPSIQDIDKLTFNDLQGIPGFGPIKAKNFVDGWKKNRDEIDILLKYVTIKQNTQLSNKLFGKKFCFTGSFSSPSRSEMERVVPEHGGKLAAVGKGLTALVSDGEIAGNKVEKAKQLNIPIITQEQFLDMLK